MAAPARPVGRQLAKHLAHAVCMVLAFGLFFPGALAASVGWRSNPTWFTAHRQLTQVGLLLAAIGLVMAFCMTPAGSNLSHGHARVGVCVLLLSLVQTAFSLADSPASDGAHIRGRPSWEVAHKLCGAAMLLGGACQVVSGYARWHGVELYAADGLSWLLSLIADRRPHLPHTLSSICCSMELALALYFGFVVLVLGGLSLGLIRPFPRGTFLLADATSPLAKACAPHSAAKHV